jgi:DNA modification methylase
MLMSDAADQRRVEYVVLDELIPATRNPKQHYIDGLLTSIGRFGYAAPALRDERTGRLVVGHGRTEALRAMRDAGENPPSGVAVDGDGRWLVPVVCGWSSRSDAEAEAYLVADNRHTELGGWDDQELADLLTGVADFDPALLEAAGYSEGDFADLLASLSVHEEESGRSAGLTDPDAIPAPPVEPISKPGDLWLLGPHRLLVGDSTNPADVRAVVGDASVTLIHADPPYGMGKEADGVANDNLYGSKLDAFQMQWWRAWLPFLADNGSAYIWGNAPDLWRLWWAGGLSADPGLLVRNEIVWDKGSAIGMRSELEHSYPTATERCLFLMRGQQFLGNQNKDDYWEGYEPLRVWLCAERDKVGWTNRDVNALTETQMAGHWFTQSQFAPISARHYRTLQDAATGRAFTKDYDELFSELFPTLRGDGNAHRRDLAAQLREDRTFFDNTHDTMCDVWSFPRVVGEDRHGHATPKPVAMVERALKSSSRAGDTIAAPFGGTGPEFIAASRLDRRVVGIELEPAWADVIARRYQEHTGEKPVLASTGEPVDFCVGGDDG